MEEAFNQRLTLKGDKRFKKQSIVPIQIIYNYHSDANL